MYKDMYECMHVRNDVGRVCMYVEVYVCMQMCICVCMEVRVIVGMNVETYECRYVCRSVFMYI
ncbi:hypothetical protein HanXRQr2_Chr06g0252121 [Helianthus annuus]|uniref:Uncharacterized protein n=1 Tax=Helianthus annuus TaxID=4232 RepID=A0A9K3NJF8_HELAN|nr:hypothetical protein HanXRQr2_Chr06g0252121 [Helianthus annuus]